MNVTASRLIDADKCRGCILTSIIANEKSADNNGFVQKCMDVAYRLALGIIEEAPTIDAVQVVRCKDCKHFHLDYMANVNGIPLIVAHEICCFNKENPIKVLQNHFCSWGERRTE